MAVESDRQEDPRPGGAAGRVSRGVPSRRPVTDRVGRALALVGVIGPLGYLVLVTVLGLGWEGYDPIRDTQSELGAVNSPSRLVMNVAGFMGVGVSILAFAVAYWLLLRRSLAMTLAAGPAAVAAAAPLHQHLIVLLLMIAVATAIVGDRTTTLAILGRALLNSIVSLPLRRRT
jgi:hypothetical membrane protein